MRLVILLLAALTLAACSSAYQAGQQKQSNDAEVAQPYGNTTVSKKITSLKGYQPTQDDVIRYKNSIREFLNANVPNLIKGAKIIIDDVEEDSFDGVSLNSVKLISVLDSSSAAILGTRGGSQVILIQTK